MVEKVCKNCAHYRRHYIMDRDSCMAINCGHCICVRIKQRKPDAKACDQFVFRDNDANLPDREGVISYLTTDFLQEVLEKMLPPEIIMDEGFDCQFAEGKL